MDYFLPIPTFGSINGLNTGFWDFIIALWNDNNPDMKQLPLDIGIPDYKSDMETIQDKYLNENPEAENE